MTALIVDDERYAREELRRLLEDFPEVQVIGEAGNAQEAREQIALLKPDMLFLDIQMPEESGFDLLASISGKLPHVIFTTAYDVYALQAFEFGVTDYLLKPISLDRLATSLGRLTVESESSRETPEADEPEQPFRPLGLNDKILLSNADKIWYVPVSQIIGAESLAANSIIWLEGGSPVIRRSLVSLEQRLPNDFFFRANRSQIINLQHVLSVSNWFSGGLKLTLTGGRTVELSRRQAKLFRAGNSL